MPSARAALVSAIKASLVSSAGIGIMPDAEDGHGRGLRATNGKELEEAIKVAVANYDGPTLIECIIDRDDALADLISWGRQVAKANARPPRPQ
jgi:pyruvate decarboxylase